MTTVPYLLFRAGGRVLRRYGTLAVRRSPRGWEAIKETVTRGGTGTWLDGAGNLRLAAAHTPRPWALDTDGDGVLDELGVLVEDAGVNLCKYSQDFTQWPAENGTPTRGTPVDYGDLRLELLGDDDAGLSESFKSLAITFTGNARKACSFHTKASTSTKQVLYLQNAITFSAVLQVDITWSGGVPTAVASGGGQLLGVFYVANGIWRIEALSAVVTASQAHEFVYYPTDPSVGSLTGQIYAGGFQAENSTICSSYIKTTSTTASRVDETITLPLVFPMQTMTLMVECYRNGTFASPHAGGFNAAVFYLGNASAPNGYLANDVSGVSASPAGAFRDADLNIPPEYPAGGRVVRLLMQIEVTPAMCQFRLDGGAGFGAWSTPPGTGGVVPWAGNTVYFGSSPLAQEAAHACIIDAVVARGLWTIQQLRAVLEAIR